MHRMPYPPSLIVLTSRGTLARYLILDQRQHLAADSQSLLVQGKRSGNLHARNRAKPGPLRRTLSLSHPKLLCIDPDEPSLTQSKRKIAQQPEIINRQSREEIVAARVKDQFNRLSGDFKRINVQLGCIKEHMELDKLLMNRNVVSIHSQVYKLDSRCYSSRLLSEVL